MSTKSRLTILFLSLTALAIPGRSAALPKPASDILLNTMERELARAQNELKKQDPAPYYLAYSVSDQNMQAAVAMQGSVITSINSARRIGDVVIRVGSLALDNSHQEHRRSAIGTATIPIEEDADAIASALWGATFHEYRRASESFSTVKSAKQVNADEEDKSADFSAEKPSVALDWTPIPPAADQAAIEKAVQTYSAVFRKYPYIYQSAAYITVDRGRKYFVSSEGSRIVNSGGVARLVIMAQTRAEDGMDLMRVETAQADSVDHLPSPQDMLPRVEKMATDLQALRQAPVAEPFTGPALLSGSAAAVFFHEVLGHRLEGQRQRGEQEGQTFTKKIGLHVLPDFLTVTDDPTRASLNGLLLSGHYNFDDEGVPSSKVDLIVNGVLHQFLMSRTPINGFSNSNGHGRGAPGNMPVGRQGNLIVTSTHSVDNDELRRKLLEEVKKQGKPYGLYFADVQGGFTLTQGFAPQAFEVLPIMVYRVYADGRPDELVRGIDLVGTPLMALEHIIVTGDKQVVFNGECGAESGSIPVSAAAPDMLVSGIEVQRRGHGLERTPILPAPGFDPEDKSSSATKGGK